MRDLSCFSLGNTIRHLSSINVSINVEHQAPFPKPKERLLSYYTYRWRPVKISDKGYYNRARLISSLIDFSFVRSLVASSYSSEGSPSYDPVSLFLLDLFRFLDGFKSMKSFCNQLHHKYNGHAYRIYAGIREDGIPCEADFSNLRVRIGEQRYKDIFHLLVEIVRRLGLVSGRIVSTDGTLVHTFARYRGCNYACIDIGDSGFDDTPNYHYVRENGSLPIFDYNPRKENLSQEALLKRGYDQKDIRLLPATVAVSLTDTTRKIRKYPLSVVNSVFPLLRVSMIPILLAILRDLLLICLLARIPGSSLTEIPRGSLRWKKIRNMRVSSERTNSTAKSDLDILDHPRVMGLKRTSILAQIAITATLLKRVLWFIARVTLSLRRFRNCPRKKHWEEFLHKIPPWLKDIIQRE